MLSFTMSLPKEKTEERRITADRRSGIDRRVASQKLIGVDMERGFARFDGNKAAWYDILRTFANDMRPRIESIDGVSEQELTEYANVIHDIKDASRGITADMLGDSAERLEDAARDGNFNYVNMHNPVFLNTLKKLIGDIDDAIMEFEARNEKPTKGKPDDETLAILREACVACSMDGVDGAMDELGKYQYDSDDGLYEWLKEKVGLMDFKAIIERLT